MSLNPSNDGEGKMLKDHGDENCGMRVSREVKYSGGLDESRSCVRALRTDTRKE